MRAITENAARAFLANRKFNSGNTSVEAYTADGKPCTRMYLHGNEIAYAHNDDLIVTLAGWPTPTTRERLNGLLETAGIHRRFYQKKNEQFFDGYSIRPDQHLNVRKMS